MDFERAFPLRFWINLGRREDRRVEMEARLDEAGITAERFAAVDARWVRGRTGPVTVFQDAGPPSDDIWSAAAPDPEALAAAARVVRGYENAGRYALALTQRLAIREAARRKAPAVLLLEDDAVFHPNFRTLIRAVDLPEDWGIFYLGCTHNEPPAWAGGRVVRAAWAVDTHAIAINAPYYRKVMEILDRHGKPDTGIAQASDQFIALLHREVPAYACYPNLAWQDASGSDLLGQKYSNYQLDGLQRNWTESVEHLLPELVGERMETVEAGGKANGVPFSPASGDPWSDGHQPLPVTTVRRRPPKLGLLFLTRDDVNHPAIWKEFADEAPDRIRILSHAKNPELVRSPFLRGTQIRTGHHTEWGEIGLVRASRELLLEALEDESVTHFMLLSESCVPIRPLPEILRRLELDPRPQFGFRTLEKAHLRHVGRIGEVPQVPKACWRFHPQWILLDRVAAVFAAAQDFTDMFSRMSVPDEAYFATVLSMQGYPLEGNVLKKDATWTHWEKDAGSPESWRFLPVERLHDLIHSGALFARKFPKGADIGRYGLHRSAASAVLAKEMEPTPR